MAMHEDLAALFSRNLSLHNPPYVAPKEEPSQDEPTYTYSITQHYHHSAHLAKQQPSRPASEPPQTDQLTTEIVLSRHGVDASSLFPSQIDLFKTADASQQMRLIELWQICPPNYGGHALSQDLWNGPATSLEQEEAMAKLRYERQMLEERMSRTAGDQGGMDNAEDTMSDASTNQPMTPIQGGDGRWMGAGSVQTPEPYMVSGYESLAQHEYERSAQRPSKDIYSHFGTAVGGPTYNQATDPVYNKVSDIHTYPNVGGDWEQLLVQRQMAMENQYGAFEQFQHNTGGVIMGGHNGEDEEML
jgi:hypothetical protein